MYIEELVAPDIHLPNDNLEFLSHDRPCIINIFEKDS
jgi:hypothetical protein